MSHFGPTAGLFTGVQMGAYFTDGTLDRIVAAMPENTMLAAHEANGLGLQNQGDVNIGWSLQFFPSGWQGAAHVALHVIPLLVLAVLWRWWSSARCGARAP